MFWVVKKKKVKKYTVIVEYFVKCLIVATTENVEEVFLQIEGSDKFEVPLFILALTLPIVFHAKLY